MKVAILSVVYYEPSWATETIVSLSKLKLPCPVFFVDRQGIGSLAEAFNRGMRENNLLQYDLVWMLTNVGFEPDVLEKLILQMEALPSFAAITPAFNSDHPFCRQLPNCNHTLPVPYIEFTAPIVRSKVFYDIPLDEMMPYAGHDIDWGYRVRERGGRVGVYHGARIDHVYIHQAGPALHPITAKRWDLRQMHEPTTKDYLHKKHGPDWKAKLQCKY